MEDLLVFEKGLEVSCKIGSSINPDVADTVLCALLTLNLKESAKNGGTVCDTFDKVDPGESAPIVDDDHELTFAEHRWALNLLYTAAINVQALQESGGSVSGAFLVMWALLRFSN